MRKFTLFFAFLCFIGVQLAFAQNKDISGKVTAVDNGDAIPGVQVLAKGTTTGTVTDIDGKYKLTVPAETKVLVFKFIGMVTKEVEIGAQKVIDVQMEADILNLEGVVVTALGITREKKSLGYATQELGGDDVNTVKGDNFINKLSGKVSGVQVKANNNMGGSTNLIIRGNSSLTGNNQALFVVDGVPINNDNSNRTDQLRGRAGYDFGNAASDINPNDIETMTILKGAAATALYGSRAANGAVIIITKKGSKTMGKKKLGVTISSNVTTGFVDKTTFPKYQQNYGAGYGTTFYSETEYPGFEYYFDMDGDGNPDYTVPTYEDASMGQKFDPNIMVYQWDSFDPANENYKKKTPWVAGENGPDYFFETPWQFTNSVEVTGGSEVSTYRLSYSNMDQTGIMPNSKLTRNNFLVNGSYEPLKNVKISSSANYIKTNGLGRNSTGYSDNIMSSFRQWMQMNVDYKQQEEIYHLTGRNVTWNPAAPDNLAPAYWDNPYFQRFENYETDQRDRIIGYIQADWTINDYFDVMARGSIDTYSELQEERKAIGSASGEFGVGNPRPDVTSGYSRFERSFRESNFDMMVNFHKDLTEDLNLKAMVGTNIQRSVLDQVFSSTDGGLIVPDLYSLGNSINPMRAPAEDYQPRGLNGFFGSISLGYKGMAYLDATIRRDESSTLPIDNDTYFYPAVSGSFLFSELVKSNWLEMGKIRLGYAQVGNYAPWGSTKNTYTQFTTFAGTALFSVPNTENNADLKPEKTSSIEAGLEMYFLKKRVGFDVAVYKMNTTDQIIPVAVSYTTGNSSKYVNAGEVQNQGVELMVFGTPIKKDKFKWDVTLNWTKNVNEVVSLAEGIENLQLAALQGGVTINARVGEPYGTIQGTDFVYHDGRKVVLANGYYTKTTTSDIVLGDINPDWLAGINNEFSYKNWKLSFLVDMQMGGSVFSLDQYYGLGTGLYEETDYINDLGNPVRDPIVYDEDDNVMPNSGGLILDGVVNTGTVENPVWVENTTRIEGGDYRVFGWSKNPNAAFVYDATYVKLREVVISYNLPDKLLGKSFFTGASVGLVGSNLWIIYKDLPHADPEAGQSSGNVQGWQSGVMPTTRNIGLTVNLSF